MHIALSLFFLCKARYIARFARKSPSKRGLFAWNAP